MPTGTILDLVSTVTAGGGLMLPITHYPLYSAAATLSEARLVPVP
jgi:hypothetical protein